MWTDLPNLLDIQPGVTAVIGSGGKTSLLRRLCQVLPGTVILCTTTHMGPPPELPLYLQPLSSLPAQKLCCGLLTEEGKLTAPGQSLESLAELADYVLVEADGSRRLPLKAHLPHEPVIPACANQVIQVVGLSGLGHPISQVAHRPERYAQLCGASLDTPVTPAMAAAVLNKEGFAHRYVLNQADTSALLHQAAALAELLPQPSQPLSLRQGPPLPPFQF